MADTALVGKLTKISPVATMILAGVVMYNGYISKSVVTEQTVAQTQQTVKELQQRVDTLQKQLAQQDVIATEVKDLQTSVTKTDTSINRLADELHSWQRAEQKYHHQ